MNDLNIKINVIYLIKLYLLFIVNGWQFLYKFRICFNILNIVLINKDIKVSIIYVYCVKFVYVYL